MVPRQGVGDRDDVTFDPNTFARIPVKNGGYALVNLTGELTVAKIAAISPENAGTLLELRKQLKDLVEQVAATNKISGKVAGAVLGHLNTVVRLLAGAVERAGLYTKNGVPQVSGRIGGMEAVG